MESLGSYIKIPESESPEKENGEQRLTPETRKETLEQLSLIKQNPKSYMDKGGAGSIHRLAAGVCMKVPLSHYENPRKEFNLGNMLPEEASFLKKVSGITYHGVRAPKYIGLVSSKELSAMLMEELPAANLQRVIAGEEPIPETFDFDTFFKSLEEYLEYLHTELGIAHGDFDSRNVMMDRETGMPYVIDFGRSKLLKRFPDEERDAIVRDDTTRLDTIIDEFLAAEEKNLLTYVKV